MDLIEQAHPIGVEHTRSIRPFLWAQALALTTIMLATPALADPSGPSFDCSRAATPVEKLICSSEALTQLDLALDSAFQSRRRAFDDELGAALLKAERQWLRDLPIRCAAAFAIADDNLRRSATIACLTERYQARITELAGADDNSGPEKLAPLNGKADNDPWDDTYNDPRFTVARIQSSLERIAVGKARWVRADGGQEDGVESITDAFSAFLNGDIPAMDLVLQKVGDIVAKRIPVSKEPQPSDWQRQEMERQANYFRMLDGAAVDNNPLTRLVAGLRRVDSILLLEASGGMRAYLEAHSVSGGMSYAQSRFSDTWLRLPCRVVVGRVAAFASVAEKLGKLTGPLLSCPTRETDVKSIESMAAEPAKFLDNAKRSAEPTIKPKKEELTGPPPQPWDRNTAVAYMGEKPSAAAAVLEAAARSDAVGKLDFALFLHAFRPASAERNKRIEGLLQEIMNDAVKVTKSDMPQNYDGTDQSLIPILRLASVSHVANTESAYYAIPCAVLITRPALVEAIASQYGSNMDNFVPRSGCANGRGSVRDFPEAEYERFTRAATNADGNFIINFQGTLKYGLMTQMNAIHETMKVNPRSFLDQPETALSYPYETWGALGLSNQSVALQIKPVYEAFYRKLSSYNGHFGLSLSEASRAAKNAIFQSVFGADCGDHPPGKSIRQMILGGAPVDDIAAQPSDAGESEEVLACSRTASLEPLMHVAVARPKVVELLLAKGHDVDEFNEFSKTPLMAAAQFDQLESARILISRGADANAMTMQSGGAFSASLYHDARTPLMYAAANSSLAMIKLLIAAGGDPYLSDTKGRRAIDYLLGTGPQEANPNLTQSERAEAVRLLY